MLLYATIWIALTLLVVAEIGRPARWARAAWLTGGVFAIVHALLALAVRFQWDHALAVRETARQSAVLYGFAWSGSIYVNYVFLALWVGLGWRWRNWWWRTFVIVMVVNGAVLFARPGARPFGAVLVALLVWTWIKPGRVRKAPGAVAGSGPL